MPKNLLKAKTERFLEIRDPKKSVGLWSHHAEFSSTLHPVAPTRLTLGRFFNADLVRHETQAEALEMIRAKGWNKSPAQKMKEYAAQYLGERFDENGKGEWPPVPRWFRAWHGFSRWLAHAKTAKPDTDVRLSFGTPVTGAYCAGEKHRTSRVVFLKKNGRNFIGVMMKDGWYGWDIIEKSAFMELMVMLNGLHAKAEQQDSTEFESGFQYNEQVTQILEYLNANLCSPITIESLAREFYLSESYICRLFKSSTGMTINKYMTARRITMAKALLAAGENVKDVCDKCGFHDYSNFLKAFTKAVGISPKKYAKYSAS